MLAFKLFINSLHDCEGKCSIIQKVRIHLLLQMVQRHEYHYDTSSHSSLGLTLFHLVDIRYNQYCILIIDNSVVLPVASTCALYLTLPTRNVHNPNDYREKLVMGFHQITLGDSRTSRHIPCPVCGRTEHDWVRKQVWSMELVGLLHVHGWMGGFNPIYMYLHT